MPPITEISSAALKEMTDRQVLAENRRLHKTFSNHLRSRVKDGVFFEAPEGSVVIERGVTVLVKSIADSKLSEGKLIAVSSDGFAYGIIKLGKPKSIDLEQFAEQTSSHRITEAERKELWPDAETLYVYPITDIGKFADPLKVKLPAEHSDIIKDIEFDDPNALDSMVVDGLSAEEIISAYFLVSTEMDLRGLKRTANDALDKALADSLRKVIRKFEGEMQGGRTQAAEGSSPVVKSEGFDGPTKEIIIPILKRNEEERTVTGVVLEPEVVDVQNEIYSAEVIKDDILPKSLKMRHIISMKQ
jgi:hypothetical protein